MNRSSESHFPHLPPFLSERSRKPSFPHRRRPSAEAVDGRTWVNRSDLPLEPSVSTGPSDPSGAHILGPTGPTRPTSGLIWLFAQHSWSLQCLALKEIVCSFLDLSDNTFGIGNPTFPASERAQSQSWCLSQPPPGVSQSKWRYKCSCYASKDRRGP